MLAVGDLKGTLIGYEVGLEDSSTKYGYKLNSPWSFAFSSNGDQWVNVISMLIVFLSSDVWYDYVFTLLGRFGTVNSLFGMFKSLDICLKN